MRLPGPDISWCQTQDGAARQCAEVRTADLSPAALSWCQTRLRGRSEVVSRRQRLRLAEIRLAYLLVLRQRFRLVGERHASGLEHVAAIGDLERHQRVLFDEQDRGSLLVHLEDRLED